MKAYLDFFIFSIVSNHEFWIKKSMKELNKKIQLYRNKIFSINKLYCTLYYNKILADSTNTKKMWDNINFIINKTDALHLLLTNSNFNQTVTLPLVSNRKSKFRFRLVNEIEVSCFLIILIVKSHSVWINFILFWPLLQHFRFFVLFCPSQMELFLII